jgi:hypothetical protein
MANETRNVLNERAPTGPLSQAQIELSRNLAEALATRWIKQTNGNGLPPATQVIGR